MDFNQPLVSNIFPTLPVQPNPRAREVLKKKLDPNIIDPASPLALQNKTIGVESQPVRQVSEVIRKKREQTTPATPPVEVGETPKQEQEDNSFSDFMNKYVYGRNESGVGLGNVAGQFLESFAALNAGQSAAPIAERYNRMREMNVLQNPDSAVSQNARRIAELSTGVPLPGASAYDLKVADLDQLSRLRQIVASKAGRAIGGGVQNELDKTAKKNLIAGQENVRNMNTMIEQYKDLIAKNPLGGLTDRESKGQMDALRSQLLFAIKDAEQTGALDKGSIDVIQGMIPDWSEIGLTGSRARSLAKLNKVQEITNNKYYNKLKSHGVVK